MIEGRDIICISSVPWDYLMISPQQTMRVLARRNRVLFVERQTSSAAWALDLVEFKRWKACRENKLRKFDKNIFILTPSLALPLAAKLVWTNVCNMAILAKEIRSTIEKLGFRDYIVWHYLPQGAYLCTRLGERINVYEIIDDYGSFPGVRRSLADRLELKMFKNADAVFAISENLAGSRQSRFPGIHVVPIGVDYDHFEKSSNPGPIPEDLASIPDPRIGYYGGIDFRLDVDLVAAAAERLKNLSFVFIGPDKEGVLQQLMSLYKNIRYLGPKPYKSIPDYLRGFSICMLPYRLSEFTRNIYPNKIFEYLASGKPVVATDIPSTRELAEQGYIRTITGEGEFCNVLSEALSDQDACARERRVDLASENSWESRVRKMENIIEEILK